MLLRTLRHEPGEHVIEDDDGVRGGQAGRCVHRGEFQRLSSVPGGRALADSQRRGREHLLGEEQLFGRSPVLLGLRPHGRAVLVRWNHRLMALCGHALQNRCPCRRMAVLGQNGVSGEPARHRRLPCDAHGTPAHRPHVDALRRMQQRDAVQKQGVGAAEDRLRVGQGRGCDHQDGSFPRCGVEPFLRGDVDAASQPEHVARPHSVAEVGAGVQTVRGGPGEVQGDLGPGGDLHGSTLCRTSA